MVDVEKITNRENGIYYTPPDLAEYLVKPLLTEYNASILDPAYGEGALLLAIERVQQQALTHSKISLFGCDIKPVNGLLMHLPEANLKKVNFFDFSVESKFDIVVTNPPYVRHHLLDAEDLKRYRKSFVDIEILKNTADLWAYFMIKSVLHLKPNGALGAILPWAFLQADYAQPLRHWLFNHFKEIKLVALSNKYFKETDERIILIWLKGYGKICKKLEIGSAKDIEQPIEFGTLSHDNWNSNRVLYHGGEEIESTLSVLKRDYGFTSLGDHADVKIGIVTGADKFFIMSDEIAKKNSIHGKNLIPILTTAKSFSELIKNGPRSLPRLIKINENHFEKYRSFLRKGISKNYHHRAHCKLRSPWYAVRIGNTPDAFFPYRTSKFPYLLLNVHGIQCTNSVHRIYFKGKLTATEKQWIQVSLLSQMGQLSLESNSKTYGRGFLKIEPTSLKKALVIISKNTMILPVYRNIIELLSNNKRSEAVQLATDFIAHSLGISEELISLIQTTVNNIQNIRTK